MISETFGPNSFGVASIDLTQDDDTSFSTSSDKVDDDVSIEVPFGQIQSKVPYVLRKDTVVA